MKAYIAFTRKEMMEYIRTYKLIVIGMVFLLLGIMNPLTAKFTPELMAQFMPEGISITLADPAEIDSWMQFFKNVPQIGLIVIVIFFHGIMAAEYAKGTLINLVTKGLRRKTVILSKFTAAVLVWTGAYLICFLASWGYTIYYFEKTAALGSLFSAVFMLWLFGVFLVAVEILGGTIWGNMYGGLLLTGAVVVVQFLLTMLPKAVKWLPVQLITVNMPVIKGEMEYADWLPAAGVTAALTIVIIAAACRIFYKKQL